MKDNIPSDIELVPDEDGFLFKIEDITQIIARFAGVLLGTLGFLILLIIHDFDVFEIARGRLGTLAVFIGLPILIYEYFNILYFKKSMDVRIIKFYKNYILIEKSNEKIYLNEIQKAYCIRINALSGKGNFTSKLLILLLFWFIPIFLGCLILSSYILRRSFFIDNIILSISNQKKYGGISYGLLNKSDKKKVEEYFKLYLNQNIKSIPVRLMFIPKK